MDCRARARVGSSSGSVPSVKVEWYVYNAGPSAMEALFAETVDLTYVGPSPAINAYTKARGEEIRIVAGAVEGGAALVVQPDSSSAHAGRFPRQADRDAAARQHAGRLCARLAHRRGTAHHAHRRRRQVVPTDNPDQLALFKSRQIDAVWTVEPWVSRLEMEAQGKVLVDEKESVTTVLVASRKRLDRQRELVRRFRRCARGTDGMDPRPLRPRRRPWSATSWQRRRTRR